MRLHSDHKPWHSGSTIFQNAPCLETMEFWEYCFSECPLFGNHGILGVLFFRMPPVWKSWHSGSTVNGNRQNWGIMLKYHLFPQDSSKDAVLEPPKSALGPRADFGGPRTASSPESLGKRWYFGPLLKTQEKSHNLSMKSNIMVVINSDKHSQTHNNR